MTIYLDHAATTPLDPDVLKKMLPYLREKFGNPSSIHSFGQESRVAVDDSRQIIAKLLGCKIQEITFTSGGTESDNLALRGIALCALRHSREGGNRSPIKSGMTVPPHLIVSASEHHAVLDTARDLEKNYGVSLSLLPVDKNGVVKLDALRRLMRPETVLVSVMYANNETGVIQPISEIARLIRELNLTRKNRIYFHTDAVQAAGYLTLNVDELGVDALSISAHKFYGPKGAGVLYLKRGTPFITPLTGGGQEHNIRSGTENVAGIVGMAAALRQIRNPKSEIRKLRDKLIAGVLKNVPDAILVGSEAARLPNIASFIFPGFDSETLLIRLDQAGIAVSSGSACTIGSVEPSHVVLAMGYQRRYAKSLIRFSLGCTTSQKEIDYTIAMLTRIMTSRG